MPPRAISPLTLFLHADVLVKLVLLVLVVASIWVWAVAIDRAVRYGRIRRDVSRLHDAARALGRETLPNGLAGEVLRAGLLAASEADGGEGRAERRERLAEAMRLCLADALRAVEPGLPFLATVGATAPFIGLFGTVWGIMASFSGIAAANDTSLAVVAPGIAEALFSTAIGLAAAIPAVIAYNKLAAHLAGTRALGISAITRLADMLSTLRPEAIRAAAA
ncbi:MAG TPA: MotA/TolQ/ExbB proton channel family protein [Acetobacteraceae bacterium]|jgi:biopolymer transport protein TolQ|nr:MotA/TolQ/ExbB proton channel family protein [Acetobacteraceae bacterium]